MKRSFTTGRGAGSCPGRALRGLLPNAANAEGAAAAEAADSWTWAVRPGDWLPLAGRAG
jgi:hypothetical protein